MNVTIPLKLLLLSLGVGIMVGATYPFALWWFLDAGLGMGLDLGRVYALWVPALLFLATIIGIIYMLQPAGKEARP